MIAKQVGKMNMLLNTEVRNGVMEVELFAWVRQKIAVATGYAFYGPENPLEMYPELKQAYWDFESGLVPLLLHILPSLTARKAYQGREKLARAMREYVEKKWYVKGCDFIQQRITLNLRHGLSPEAAGRAE